jgi:hypothetical protein
MSTRPPATLREVRRGPEPNELLLVDEAGRVTILLGYGLTLDEQSRTREAAITLLSEVLAR